MIQLLDVESGEFGKICHYRTCYHGVVEVVVTWMQRGAEIIHLHGLKTGSRCRRYKLSTMHLQRFNSSKDARMKRGRSISGESRKSGKLSDEERMKRANLTEQDIRSAVAAFRAGERAQLAEICKKLKAASRRQCTFKSEGSSRQCGRAAMKGEEVCRFHHEVLEMKGDMQARQGKL